MEDSIQELADAIYREKVLRARKTPDLTKMSDGPNLFADSLERMRAGLRSEFPAANSAEIEVKLRKQLDRLSRLHDHGIYEKSSN